GFFSPPGPHMPSSAAWSLTSDSPSKSSTSRRGHERANCGTTFCRAECTLTSEGGISMPVNTEFATLNYPGGELDLQIVHATEGSDGIALGSLLSKTGYTTYDEGFVNTASTKSAITYIDGDAGI